MRPFMLMCKVHNVGQCSGDKMQEGVLYMFIRVSESVPSTCLHKVAAVIAQSHVTHWEITRYQQHTTLSA